MHAIKFSRASLHVGRVLVALLGVLLSGLPAGAQSDGSCNVLLPDSRYTLISYEGGCRDGYAISEGVAEFALTGTSVRRFRLQGTFHEGGRFVQGVLENLNGNYRFSGVIRNFLPYSGAAEQRLANGDISESQFREGRMVVAGTARQTEQYREPPPPRAAPYERAPDPIREPPPPRAAPPERVQGAIRDGDPRIQYDTTLSDRINREGAERTRAMQAQFDRDARLRLQQEQQQAAATAAENRRRQDQAQRDLAAANAESARKQAENQRTYEEAQRRRDEQNRQAVERLAAEQRASDARLAEQNRLNAIAAAEANRKAQEETRRQQAEWDRQAALRAEVERRQALATAAENQRRQEQAARDLAAANAESARKIAENQRAYEESQRRLAEQDRLAKEKVAADDRAAQARLVEQNRQNAIAAAAANKKAAEETARQQAEFDRQAAVRKEAERQQALTTAAENKARQEQAARDLAAANGASAKLLAAGNAESARKITVNDQAYADSQKRLAEQDRLAREKVAADDRAAQARFAEQIQQNAMTSTAENQKAAAETAKQQAEWDRQALATKSKEEQQATATAAENKARQDAAARNLAASNAESQRLLAASAKQYEAQKQTEAATAAQMKQDNSARALALERDKQSALAALSTANGAAPKPQSTSYTQQGQTAVQSSPWPSGTPYPTVQPPAAIVSTPTSGSQSGQTTVQSNPWPTGTPYPTVQAPAPTNTVPVVALAPAAQPTVQSNPWPTGTPYPTVQATVVVGSRASIAPAATVVAAATPSPSIPSFATPVPVQGTKQLGPLLPTPASPSTQTASSATLANTLIVGSAAGRSGNANSTPMLASSSPSTGKDPCASSALQGKGAGQLVAIGAYCVAKFDADFFEALALCSGLSAEQTIKNLSPTNWINIARQIVQAGAAVFNDSSLINVAVGAEWDGIKVSYLGVSNAVAANNSASAGRYACEFGLKTSPLVAGGEGAIKSISRLSSDTGLLARALQGSKPIAVVAAVKEVTKIGGAYDDLPIIAKHDRHHMPADSASNLLKGRGPAIVMETIDHNKTASYGAGALKAKYRVTQEQLVKSGRFMEAIQMDIDDVRSLFGGKYDDAILQMLDYARSLGLK